MKLRDAIHHYVAWRRASGVKFRNGESMLNRFLKSVGEGISCDDVTPAQVRSFLLGNGRHTRTRSLKYSALNGLYRYAMSRGYASSSPLPDNEPKTPAPMPPYVYSREEVRRLFDAIPSSRQRAHKLDGHTFRTFLLLLYRAGLRGSEARSLTMEDVDLSTAVLTVRNSKFYKTRLVPAGPHLAAGLREYKAQRIGRSLPEGQDSTFLANKDGTPLTEAATRQAFEDLLVVAGIHSTDARFQSPCLHSLRHSFAVHRLTDWYRQGADVQELLPWLSTYLGHSKLASTQVYLSMTPELLQEASLRLERYLGGANSE